MSRPVTLRINRLVLGGVAPGDAAMLTAALRQELLRKFADTAHAATSAPRRMNVDAGDHAADATASATGRALAGTIHKAVIR
jgi:hypothetical protein